MTTDRIETPKQHEQKESEQNSSLNLVDLGQSTKCTEDVVVKQRAKVGPYEQIQVDKESYCEGAAHPSDEHRYSTFDSRSHEQLKLTDIFKREDIYAALMKDPLVRKALDSDDAIYRNPKNFEELESDLYGRDGLGVVLFDSGKKDSAGNEVSFRLSDRILTDFAFHDVKNGMVGTRLLPDYASEASRNAMYQLGVYLPIPSGMEAEFRDAANRRNGEFLMKDSAKLGKVSQRHNDWEQNF